MTLKAPFPYFGGKRHAAPLVWQRLGDPEHYVEPFAGSLAVLLNRPHSHYRGNHSETVNDIDGLLVNVWRSIQRHPVETAEWAAWPVTEADLTACHLDLVNWRAERQLERLMGDPDWCDPRMAGRWLQGIAGWIGSGWCAGAGAWVRGPDNRIARRRDQPDDTDIPGVSRKRPQLVGEGRGVNHPSLREPLPAGPAWPGGSLATQPLLDWFRQLADRLRWVRIVNGDWRRVCTNSAIRTLAVRNGGTAGIFLDPPYAAAANRDSDLYAHDSDTVADEVRDWCFQAPAGYRIVLAGFADERDQRLLDAGWTEHEWFTHGFLRGGRGNTGEDAHRQTEERLWASPACMTIGAAHQQLDLMSDT